MIHEKVSGHPNEPARKYNSLLEDRDELLDALRWFCGRVESGEVRSKRTYARFKRLIAERTPKVPA